MGVHLIDTTTPPLFSSPTLTREILHHLELIRTLNIFTMAVIEKETKTLNARAFTILARGFMKCGYRAVIRHNLTTFHASIFLKMMVSQLIIGLPVKRLHFRERLTRYLTG